MTDSACKTVCGRRPLKLNALAGLSMQRYWVESDEVWSADDRGVIWRGRPDGKPAKVVVGIPGTDDAAVLLDAESGPRDENGKLRTWPHLVRIRPTGEVVWRIAAGTGSGERDWWTSLQVVEGALTANTWSCYYQTLDEKTGRVRSSTFTK